ncbi:ABC transporter ATP-binding protein [Acidisoma cellulosilytica]|uniref:ABC transporter ATP-binding protein n=1 Tax=Acidisoma cellulosilyticum TaxID=2802395 RepID=A0A963Z6Q1_9PROT|nr:ABC transporter ATP-binding protein [Acidisoma cellulosilyticum]MCB8883539.1 ABC transporter ATP-binding protein [Acidisoma cellulosilyticum]
MSALLDVEDLAVRFRSDSGEVTALEGVSFSVAAGETLAIVGESSSGKSVSALAIMRLLPPAPACRVTGRIRFQGRDGPISLLDLPERAMVAVRGGEIAMIFQEPMTSLNPVHMIGRQIAEAVLAHEGGGKTAALRRAIELLDLVGIPDAARRAESYPHQLSGGMRQRAMIAMALASRPKLLIADEPTTALDVTVQAQILDLLRRLQAETGLAIIFITHNLGVVAEIADRTLVMYSGQVVEEAPTASLLAAPLMPYTRGLLNSVPRLEAALRPGQRLPAIAGNVPDPRHRPAACTFQPRCDWAQPDICGVTRPGMERVAEAHLVRCARWREIAV